MAFLNKTGLEHLWKHIVAKLTSYAPSKSGDGAHGTWNIDISGNATKADKATSADTATKANTATKLENAKTINIGGHASGTAQSFDGSNNVVIPVSQVMENIVRAGGPAISGSVSSIDMAMNEDFSANRLAYMPANDIVVEYSNDGGATWLDYGMTDAQKQSLVTLNSDVRIGKKSADITTNDQMRVTITAAANKTYFSLKKILLRVTTNGAIGSQVLIEKALIGDDTAFSAVGTYGVSGWSGWNSIPLVAAFGGSTNQTSQIRKLRFTFSITGLSTSNNALGLLAMRMYGENSWGNSGGSMAANGHIYSYDIDKNANFPAKVTAPIFSGSLSGNATSATKATQDGNGNVITETYAKKSDVTVTSVNNKTGSIVLSAADVGAITEEDFISDSKIDEICGESILGNREIDY